MTHIETGMLLDVLEGRASLEDRGTVRRHLAECGDCAEAFGAWTALLDAMSLPELESAPRGALQRAMDMFEPPEPKKGVVGEIIASLVTDTWLKPAAQLRGQSPTRQISMSAAEFDLDVRVVYQEDITEIRGQMLRRAGRTFPDDFEVSLIDNFGHELDEAYANEFGEFRFDRGPTEAAGMVVRMRDGRNIRCNLPRE